MSASDSTVLIVKNASVWLCESGRTEYEGYIRSISPLGFTAALCHRNRTSAVDGTAPSGQPFPDLAGLLIGRRFVAAVCGRDYSAIVEATATEIQKLTGSAFDYSVTCRFNTLDTDQKRMIVGLIIEHYAPPSMAM
ncbi:MAG: hypothetical protein K8T20_10200 [Planctomycetes bacterium]|nr:hypothetical protein [Planctomycetota bacterium]